VLARLPRAGKHPRKKDARVEAKKGRKLGRPKGSFKKPDPQLLTQVYKLKSEGLSYREIAARLGKKQKIF
jgi:hypothetical protein